MKYNKVADKIITLRKGKGLSQGKLADMASINLRTLQRIETGTTLPRGETLCLIAEALEQPLEIFLGPNKVEDKGFLQLLNLSTLSFWIIPLGNIFIPLAFWLLKKDKVKGVEGLGKRLINFQITWSIITLTLSFIFLFLPMLNISWVPAISPLYVILVAGVLYFLNSILIICASIQINRGKERVYGMSWKIVSL